MFVELTEISNDNPNYVYGPLLIDTDNIKWIETVLVSDDNERPMKLKCLVTKCDKEFYIDKKSYEKLRNILLLQDNQKMVIE